MSRRFSLLPRLALLGMILCIPWVHAQHDGLDEKVAEATLIKAGQAAPAFHCQTTTGAKFDLAAQKGKVVLLYFFDKVPAACATELRYIEKEIFQPLAQRQDFAILGVGRGMSREDVVQMGGASGVAFPLAADASAEIFGQYFKGYVPRAVIISSSGMIVHVKSGYHEFDGITVLKGVLSRQMAK